MSNDHDMALPEGRTCSDCEWFARCKGLFQCKPEAVRCDWAPSRFRLSEAAIRRDAIRECIAAAERVRDRSASGASHDYTDAAAATAHELGTNDVLDALRALEAKR